MFFGKDWYQAVLFVAVAVVVVVVIVVVVVVIVVVAVVVAVDFFCPPPPPGYFLNILWCGGVLTMNQVCCNSKSNSSQCCFR